MTMRSLAALARACSRVSIAVRRLRPRAAQRLVDLGTLLAGEPHDVAEVGELGNAELPASCARLSQGVAPESLARRSSSRMRSKTHGRPTCAAFSSAWVVPAPASRSSATNSMYAPTARAKSCRACRPLVHGERRQAKNRAASATETSTGTVHGSATPKAPSSATNDGGKARPMDGEQRLLTEELVRLDPQNRQLAPGWPHERAAIRRARAEPAPTDSGAPFAATPVDPGVGS